MNRLADDSVGAVHTGPFSCVKTAEHNRRCVYMHINSQTLANVHLKMFILTPDSSDGHKTVSDLIWN